MKAKEKGSEIGFGRGQVSVQNHAAVRYAGKIYDSSYGLRHNDFLSWENSGLEGVGAIYWSQNDPNTERHWISTANRAASRETDDQVLP